MRYSSGWLWVIWYVFLGYICFDGIGIGNYKIKWGEGWRVVGEIEIMMFGVVLGDSLYIVVKE